MPVDRARSDGLPLTGEGGLQQQLTKRSRSPPWRARSPAKRGATSPTRRAGTLANSRKSTRTNTVLTDFGAVELKEPRDVAGTFEPQIVNKRQRCLTGEDPRSRGQGLPGSRCNVRDTSQTPAAP
ncbi:transposase [Streptomyces sp. NBC_01614]|uniref:Transposase n=1 Tax=Streptomyces sp. NBC_00180 TaxID=2903632 RepID=A0AAU1IAT8_9ACTN